MYSEARTVDEYLAALPADRREDISKVRDVILASLPEGYAEVMNWGMIAYQVPLEVYPDTYNGKPLMYAALASQKQYMALYLMSIYMSAESREVEMVAVEGTEMRCEKVTIGGFPEWRLLRRLLVLAKGFHGSET